MALIGKQLLFLIERAGGEGRQLGNVSNYHNGYVVHQICHDKQVLIMFHTKEYLTAAQEACLVLFVITLCLFETLHLLL